MIDAPFMSDHEVLKAMPHLNAVINEALRLHPALPSGGLRQTPPDGVTIAGQYIPGNVVVSAPRYSLGRCEFLEALFSTSLCSPEVVQSCYERRDDFVPERWYSRSEMTKNDKAFAPFSTGKSSRPR